MLKKLFFSLVFLLIFVFIFPQNLAQAQTESSAEYFDTKLHTTVTVNDTGQSRIKHEFTITNKTPTTYISQYGLKISSAELKNVTVTSNGQALKPEVVSTKTDQLSGPGQTSIGITFPDKIVGEGKSRQFTISYSNPDAAIISGNILEVGLPPQANPQDYSNYQITLITPLQFGGPTRTTPPENTFTTQGSQVITNFQHGGERGTFALFGSLQIFNLDLIYHLNNSTNNPGITQIALPPDTTFQKVHYQQLEPKPEKIELDEDGNWIATYHLPASTDTIVNLKATTLLTLEPNVEIPVPSPTQALLQNQEYWPVNHPDIKKITQKYATPKEINDFVVKTLNYNTALALNFPERLGAIEALNQPDQAVCQEFTDVFITLARSAGIYARRTTGYAHSQNSTLRPLSLVEDILHAWPEYFDPEQARWIPIDPTWENTTGGVDYFHQLDLNHIVFAINGQNSITPHPAGSYKELDSTEKTINVDFGTDFPTLTPSIKLKISPQKIMGLKIPGNYHLEVTNPTGQAFYNLLVQIQPGTSHLRSAEIPDKIQAILPFQTLSFPFRLESSQHKLPQAATILVKIANESQEFNLTTSPSLDFNFKFINKKYYWILAGSTTLLTLITGSILVFRHKK